MLGAPNVKDFQKIIAEATDSQGANMDFRKPSVESVAYVSVSNNDG